VILEGDGVEPKGDGVEPKGGRGGPKGEPEEGCRGAGGAVGGGCGPHGEGVSFCQNRARVLQTGRRQTASTGREGA